MLSIQHPEYRGYLAVVEQDAISATNEPRLVWRGHAGKVAHRPGVLQRNELPQWYYPRSNEG